MVKQYFVYSALFNLSEKAKGNHFNSSTTTKDQLPIISNRQSLPSSIDFHGGIGTQKEYQNKTVAHNKLCSNSTGQSDLKSRPHSLGVDNVVKSNCAKTKNDNPKFYSCLEDTDLADLTAAGKINQENGDKAHKSNKTELGGSYTHSAKECIVSFTPHSVSCSDKTKQPHTKEKKNNGCHEPTEVSEEGSLAKPSIAVEIAPTAKTTPMLGSKTGPTSSDVGSFDAAEFKGERTYF